MCTRNQKVYYNNLKCEYMPIARYTVTKIQFLVKLYYSKIYKNKLTQSLAGTATGSIHYADGNTCP